MGLREQSGKWEGAPGAAMKFRGVLVAWLFFFFLFFCFLFLLLLFGYQVFLYESRELCGTLKAVIF